MENREKVAELKETEAGDPAQEETTAFLSVFCRREGVSPEPSRHRSLEL